MALAVEKYIGCLVGLALGDALGSLAERSQGGISPGAAGSPPAGTWVYTSDTQRALLVAESLIACSGPEPGDLCRRFLAMAQGPDHLPLGCFRRPSRNFRAALGRLQAGWRWQDSGSDSPGIGAAVQVAPVGLMIADRESLMDAVILLSVPTHRDPRAVAAAAAVAYMVSEHVHRTSLDTVSPRARLQEAREFVIGTERILHERYRTILSIEYLPVLHQLSDTLEMLDELLALDQQAALSQLGDRVSELAGRPVQATAGLAIAGVPAAIWFALVNGFRFEAAISGAIKAGGDAGSVGAICGALCGSFRPDTILTAWKTRLANCDQIGIRACRLAGHEVPEGLMRDLVQIEQPWTELFHKQRKKRQRFQSPVVGETKSDEVFGLRFVSGRSGDPCLFFFDGNLGLCGLFDLGRTFALRPADVRRLDYLLVTHTHIDHFIGFDHILRHSLNRPTVLHIFGPARITHQVQHRLRSYIWNLRRWLRLEVKVHEVTETGVTISNLSMRTAFTKREVEGTAPYQGIVYSGDGFLFKAATLHHGMPCLGYAIEEPPSVRVDKERLQSSGLRPGPWLRQLKETWQAGRLEETYLQVDAKRLSAACLAQDLLVPRAGRKVAYVVDTTLTGQTHERIVELARGADLFVCEATFSHQLDLDQARRKAHLTALQAGQLARDAQVKRLHIFHFSRRYQNKAELLVREARRAAGEIEVTY